jgi:ribonuclease-3 family protein
MEASIRYLQEQFQLNQVDIRTYSPATLAYIGDGIYDLLIRTIVINRGNCQTNKLHKKVSALVKASRQSEMIQVLKPHLTQEETAIYKRGRNAKPNTVAKNASVADYRRATGFEAVMGYLYLMNQIDRIVDLMKLGLTEEKNDEQ